jgi:hypothetical protein
MTPGAKVIRHNSPVKGNLSVEAYTVAGMAENDKDRAPY